MTSASPHPKRLLILGSTGSIGQQTLQVVAEAPEHWDIVGLSAHTNADRLEDQAQEWNVTHRVLTQHRPEDPLQNEGAFLEALGAALECGNPKPLFEFDPHNPLVELIERVKPDVVMAAISGSAGLIPTLAAIRTGADVALANKEALVMAGELVMNQVQRHGTRLEPVDSEHAALAACLKQTPRPEIDAFLLTGSGGPFLHHTPEQLRSVTVQDALRHPTWSMGAKISIDSATWMNKGFEVIEAHHLFGVDYDQIEVLIHPQSIVHGLLRLKDGRFVVQFGAPDMKAPIRAALQALGGESPPARPSPNSNNPLPTRILTKTELLEHPEWTFLPPEHPALKGLERGYTAGRRGGLAPARLTLKNDRAVQQFLAEEISFWELTQG